MQLKISLPSIFIFAILFSINCASVMAGTLRTFDGKSIQSSASNASDPDVAWIESVNPKDSLSKSKIVIYRQDKRLPIDISETMPALKSGDRILINAPRAYLNLYTSTGARLLVTADIAKKEGYVIDVRPNSIKDNIIALFDKFKPGQTRAVSASTKGTRGAACPQQEEENFPSIPADQTEAPKMAAGERALHFIWHCGKPPYRLSLVHNDKVIEFKVSEGFEATLPKHNLLPGTYKLVLKDIKGLVPGVDPLYGNAVVEENLILVAPADVPPMPAELVQSTLPEEIKQLFYADWLARQGNGEWRMEAIQHVFPYAKDYEPAADWLRQWGGQ